MNVLFVTEHRWTVQLTVFIYPCVNIDLHTVKLPIRASYKVYFYTWFLYLLSMHYIILTTMQWFTYFGAMVPIHHSEGHKP